MCRTSEQCSTLGRCLISIVAAAGTVATTLWPASAQAVYPSNALQQEAPRLQRAVNQIYVKGVKPELTVHEASALANVRFTFPMPQRDDSVLNFYAGELEGQPTVVLPLQSLKMLEDLAVAFAWLYETQRSFAPLDVYFAMLQRKAPQDFGPPGSRDILSVLGVPKNVLKNKKIDQLSLSLRNEAFAFILVHELGHLLFKHKGVAGISPAEARADEVQSDAFALDVLARTGTPPMGAVMYFQAQIFALPHRGDHKTASDWQNYLDTASTHPLSVDRIRAMAAMIAGPLAARRTTETVIWKDIGRNLSKMSTMLADVELHNCMTKVAETAPVSLLRQTGKAEHSAIKRMCRE